ncbi:hypothetical protein M7I_6206 [Glarea lozoyensis 74030]|uniref:Uncharacterized protein n=1 Tax=Glarea lozoyensis (strain ATCC 74030 / MF5533) TaxID=1104152 RepID=H0ETY2_GLAL7|nr:hypothetical protein M7I_6206 [Glarea lozoyensis 74030]
MLEEFSKYRYLSWRPQLELTILPRHSKDTEVHLNQTMVSSIDTIIHTESTQHHKLLWKPTV